VAIDARTRLLRQGGVIVPAAIEVFVVPVEDPDAHARYIDCWADDLSGVDFSSVRSIAANTPGHTVVGPPAYLADPASFGRFRLLDVSTPEVQAEITWTARRRGTLHGCGGWFAAELAPGIELSNAPPRATPSWGHAFFPLERPVTLEAGH